MSELIPLGTAETEFSDGTFSVDAGSFKYLFIKGPPNSAGESAVAGPVEYELALVTSDGDYNVIRSLSENTYLKYGAVPAGSYALRRVDTSTESGVDITG